MRFGLGIWLEDEIRETLKLVKAAEDYGFDYVWFPDHYFLKDSYVVQTLACYVTSRINVGTAIVSPFLRHPLAIASAVASLDEISGGRAVLGLGSGGHEFPSQLLINIKLPRTACMEAITIIREAWGGKTVNFSGKVFSVKNAKLHYKPIREDIPIYLAARGPKMMALASQMCDGVITHGTTERFVSYVAGLIRKESQRSVDLTIYAPAMLSGKREEVFRALAPHCLLMAGGEYSEEFIELYELGREEVLRLKEAVRIGSPEAVKLVTPDMVESFSIIGKADEVIEKIDRLGKAGMTQLTITIPQTLVKNGLVESIPKFLEEFNKQVISYFKKQ